MSLLAPHPLLYDGRLLRIYAHGLFFALGALAGSLLLARLAARKGLAGEGVPRRALLIFAAGLAAARLGYFLSYPSQFTSLGQVAAFWGGGLVSYWGLAGGLAMAAWLFRGRQRWEWLDLLVLATLPAWGLGRLGNYYAADSVGVISPAWNAFYGRVPIQLLESALCLALFAVLLPLWRRERLQAGRIGLLALAAYLSGRFLVDIWRDEGSWLGLHLSQWADLALALPAWVAFCTRGGRRAS